MNLHSANESNSRVRRAIAATACVCCGMVATACGGRHGQAPTPDGATGSLVDKQRLSTGVRLDPAGRSSRADRIDDDAFNRVLWRAIKGTRTPFPSTHRVGVQEYVRAH